MTTVLNAGGEFRVNTYTQYAQWASSVAALTDGGFVITWMSYGQVGPWRDDAGYGIYAQRYDATGTPVGQEFRVNTTTNSYQERPAGRRSLSLDAPNLPPPVTSASKAHPAVDAEGIILRKR